MTGLVLNTKAITTTRFARQTKASGRPSSNCNPRSGVVATQGANEPTPGNGLPVEGPEIPLEEPFTKEAMDPGITQLPTGNAPTVQPTEGSESHRFLPSEYAAAISRLEHAVARFTWALASSGGSS